MITNQLLNIIYYFVYTILAILPSGHIPEAAADAISTMGGYLEYIKIFFPVDTLLTVLGLILATEAIFLSYYFIMWIIHRIPGE